MRGWFPAFFGGFIAGALPAALKLPGSERQCLGSHGGRTVGPWWASLGCATARRWTRERLPWWEYPLKNIQVIDSAANCSFSIYAATEEDFAEIFCNPGQDVEFVEDIVARLGTRRAGELIGRATKRRLDKCGAMGIHGTLFFGMPARKRWYPNKREDDLDAPGSALR